MDTFPRVFDYAVDTSMSGPDADRIQPATPLLHLLDTKFPDICIKDELLACDQGDLQERPITFKSFSRNALNKAMTLEQGRPHCWKIISLAYQLGALAREIAGSVL
jgi:hypothetical protein